MKIYAMQTNAGNFYFAGFTHAGHPDRPHPLVTNSIHGATKYTDSEYKDGSELDVRIISSLRALWGSNVVIKVEDF